MSVLNDLMEEAKENGVSSTVEVSLSDEQLKHAFGFTPEDFLIGPLEDEARSITMEGSRTYQHPADLEAGFHSNLMEAFSKAGYVQPTVSKRETAGRVIATYSYSVSVN